MARAVHSSSGGRANNVGVLSSPNNKEGDPLPLEWGMCSSEEDTTLELLNAVELEQEDAFGNNSNINVNGMNRHECEGADKRKRDEEENDDAPSQDGGDPRGGMLQMDSSGFLMEADERPRVSRRRKKKPKGMPKRPMNAYAIFYHQERLRMVECMTEGSLSEDDIQRQVGKLWRALSAEQVSRYEKQAEEDKARFHEEMDAYHGNSSCKALPKNDLRKDLRKQVDEEHQSDPDYGFPPPPPGVMVIPGRPRSGRESVASSSDSSSTARRARNNQASPIPPPISSRWNYQPPPPAMPQMHPHAFASLPSPLSSVHSPSRVGRLVYHGGPYADYYHHASGHRPVPPPSWAACPSSPSWGAAPPSPYSPRSSAVLLPPPLSPRSNNNGRPYSPHPAYSSAAYSIPPGMEFALPTRNGGEQKYTVTYRCYTMRREDVPSFMESLNANAAGARPPRAESLQPSRPPSTYSSHHAANGSSPVIQHRPSW
jgi:HMG (high mobility group) box